MKVPLKPLRKMKTRVRARAKINLCLHVVGLRNDGLHLLDSIVAFAEFGDKLTFEAAEQLSLTIDGPFGVGLSNTDDNLILKAAQCYADTPGCAVHLQKNLPVAAGIGGGSADAAAALRGLSQLWQKDLPPAGVQLTLGADVPVCVHGQTTRMQGIGERLTPLASLPDLPVVLVNPGCAVPTGPVFSALQSKNNLPIAHLPEAFLNIQQAVDWLLQQRNDLEAPAITLEPVIGEVLQELRNSHALMSRMSGSGATCFGVFDTLEKAHSAARKIAKLHAGWWIEPTVIQASNHPRDHKI